MYAYGNQRFNKETPSEHQLQTVYGSPVKLPCNSNRLEEREGMAHACSSASVRVYLLDQNPDDAKDLRYDTLHCC